MVGVSIVSGPCKDDDCTAVSYVRVIPQVKMQRKISLRLGVFARLSLPRIARIIVNVIRDNSCNSRRSSTEYYVLAAILLIWHSIACL